MLTERWLLTRSHASGAPGATARPARRRCIWRTLRGPWWAHRTLGCSRPVEAQGSQPRDDAHPPIVSPQPESSDSNTVHLAARVRWMRRRQTRCSQTAHAVLESRWPIRCSCGHDRRRVPLLLLAGTLRRHLSELRRVCPTNQRQPYDRQLLECRRRRPYRCSGEMEAALKCYVTEARGWSPGRWPGNRCPHWSARSLIPLAKMPPVASFVNRLSALLSSPSVTSSNCWASRMSSCPASVRAVP